MLHDAHFDNIVQNFERLKKPSFQEVREKIKELKVAQAKNEIAMKDACHDDRFDRGMLIHEMHNIVFTLRKLQTQYDKMQAELLWGDFKSSSKVSDLAMCVVFWLQFCHPNMWVITAWYTYVFANFAAVCILCTKLSGFVLFMALVAFILGLCETRIANIFQMTVSFASLIWAHIVFFEPMPCITFVHGLFITLHLIAKAKLIPLKKCSK